MSVVAIGLGSNLGDRAATLRGALADLGVAGRLQAVSSIYQTEPVGGPDDQLPYLNAVCLLETSVTGSSRKPLDWTSRPFLKGTTLPMVQ